MGRLVVTVQLYDEPGKCFLSDHSKIKSTVHFALEDGLSAESATLEELEKEIGKRIDASEYTLLDVPFQDKPCLLRLPEESGQDIYSSLTPMKSDDELKSYIRGERSTAQFKEDENESYEISDVSSVLYDQKPRGKESSKVLWLSHDQTIQACNERDLLEVDKEYTLSQLRDKLREWYNRRLQYTIKVYLLAEKKLKEVASKSSSKKRKSMYQRGVVVDMLRPEVYLNGQDRNECAFENTYIASEIMSSFNIPNFSEEMKYEEIHGKIVSEYEKFWPSRKFVNEALFVQTVKNRKSVAHIENMETFLNNVRDGHIRVAFGGEHKEPIDGRGGGEYPKDEHGHYFPPLNPTVKGAKGLSAQRDKRIQVEKAVKVLYNHESSPLFRAFTMRHAKVISGFLETKDATANQLLEGLLMDPPKFNDDMNNYICRKKFIGGWSDPTILSVVKRLPVKNQFDIQDDGGIPFDVTPLDDEKKKDPISVGEGLVALGKSIEQSRAPISASTKKKS